MSRRNHNAGSSSKSLRAITGRSKIVKLFASLIVWVVAGTQTSCESGPKDDETLVGTASQAVIQPFTVSFTLPPGVALTTMAAAAKSSLSSGDRTQIQGPMGVSAGPLVVTNDAKVRALTAGGNVTIGDRAVITGNVRASGAVTRSPSSTVNGTVQDHVNLGTPQTVQWTFQADNVSSGDVNLEPDQTRDLLPGSYGMLTVKSRASVTLHTGVYLFNRIDVEPQAKLLIDSVSGPVQTYITGGLIYRGAIQTARFGLPQLLIADLGTDAVFIESPLTAALIAPNADVHFQAALPQGHRAVIYGKTVTMEPDTIVRVLPFDWGGVDPRLQPPPDPTGPAATMPRSPADIPIGVDNNGKGPSTSSGDSPTPIGFNLPPSYPVAGGEICNSTVTFRFRQGSGPLVTCTYRGGSPTATPTTELDLNLGRTLNFQSCTDNLPVTTQRLATHFELAVTPCAGFAVTVNSPVVNDKKCSEQLPLLTVDQTRQMRQSFTWTGKTHIAATNPDGTPALYYAWTYIKNKDEALALRKLYIHVLSRPLFADELNQFSGKCGAITNPGDGVGTFVPVVIPGGIYNKIIDALTSNSIQGDKVIFDALIIRQVPAASRNPNGSIRVDQLVNSGFQYLHYETSRNPLPDFHTMQLDGGVSKILVDAVSFVAETAIDVAEIVTNSLGILSRLLLGTVNIDLNLWATNIDANFPGNVMLRGWGGFAGQPLGAPGLQVTIIQPFLALLPIPATSMGNTNMTGHVHIDAFTGLGSAMCIETKNDGALVSDFLIANEICDFRGFVDTSSPFFDMTADKRVDLQINEPRLTGMYEAADVFEWDKAVGHFTPKRARITSGYWGDTITTRGEDGYKRLYAPCLNFGNSVSDALLVASQAAGGILSALVPVGVVIAAAEEAVVAVLNNTDIVLAMDSHVRISREVMSHEYGHYTLCDLLVRNNPNADDYIQWSTIALGDDQSAPLRYMNEAFADFIAGQVAGAADYLWLHDAEAQSGYPQYCFGVRADGLPSCWDENRRDATTPGDKQDTNGIARIATLYMDAFDGNPGARGSSVPGNGDNWTAPDATSPLTYSMTNYLDQDSQLERVHLPGVALQAFAAELAAGLPAISIGGQALIDDARIYRSVNNAMRALPAPDNYNWCDRCRVLALHSTNFNFSPGSETVPLLIQHCLSDPFIAAALQEPPPAINGNFDFNSCAPCPPGQLADGNGGCGQCPADVVLDGSTLGSVTFDPTAVRAPNDICPNVFIVQVNNPQGAFAKGASGIEGSVGPIFPFTGTQDEMQTSCQRSYQLGTAREAATGFVNDPPLTATGVFKCSSPPSPCIPSCSGLPFRGFVPGDIPGNSSVRFSTTATDPTIRLTVTTTFPIP